MAKHTRCEIAGQELWCFPEKALYWPAQSTLVVADLHWGKAETFQRAGIPVPRTGFDEDLARLLRLLVETQAKRLLILGDLIHSRQGFGEAVSRSVTIWRQQMKAEIVWILGNHDRSARLVPESWGMQLIEGSFFEGPFCFTHEPEAAALGFYTLCGHLHPVVRLQSRLDRLRLPCFYFEQKLGILPAFGYFTGGAEIQPSSEARVLAVMDGSLWDLGPQQDIQGNPGHLPVSTWH